MKILIIGNGFDLAQGLPTSYDDFLNLANVIESIYHYVFFSSTFWTKLQNIFGHYCKSKLDKVAKPRLVAILPAE